MVAPFRDVGGQRRCLRSSALSNFALMTHCAVGGVETIPGARAYFALVAPFHRRIVPGLLERSSRSGWAHGSQGMTSPQAGAGEVA